MTGNDIVDITVAAAESDWRRKGFLEKIFTLQEQLYINNAALPNEMVWKLWSMKESAYKIYARQYGGRFFAPQKFGCTLLSATTGLVTFNKVSYQTTTIAAKKYIYSIACLKGLTNTELLSSCFYLPQMEHSKQQQFIYRKIVDCYTSAIGQGKEDTSVVKDKNGIPFLHCSNNLQIPVSITHHGQFAAFTIN
jgi:phosphopantetheinyl transferase (holo-ACP synthase)